MVFPAGNRPKKADATCREQHANPDVVEDYLAAEVARGNIVGLFSPGALRSAHFNRVGVIPKKHQTGKWRLITDLSYPEGKSVNDAIDKLACSMKYISVQDVANVALKLGKRALKAKIDIKYAYRLSR